MDKPTLSGFIKALFNSDSDREKFAKVTLDTGQVAEAESFEVGSEFFVVTDSGELAPAGAGEYMTESGETIVVDESSIITEIVPAGSDADEDADGDEGGDVDMNSEESEEGSEEGEESEEAKFATVSDFEAFKAEIREEIKGALAELVGEFKKEMSSQKAASEEELKLLKEKFHTPRDIEDEEEEQSEGFKFKTKKEKVILEAE